MDERRAPRVGSRSGESEELLQRTPRQRAADFGVHLGQRRVKLAAPAFEKAVEHKGVRRNHLLAGMTAFKLDAPEEAVAPLLAAAAGGVLEALRSDRTLDHWRRLGGANAEMSTLEEFARMGGWTPEEPEPEGEFYYSVEEIARQLTEGEE